MPPREIWIMSAKGLHDSVVETVKRIRCSCGFEDKCFKQDADSKAIGHNRDKHKAEFLIRGLVGKHDY